MSLVEKWIQQRIAMENLLSGQITPSMKTTYLDESLFKYSFDNAYIDSYDIYMRFTEKDGTFRPSTPTLMDTPFDFKGTVSIYRMEGDDSEYLLNNLTDDVTYLIQPDNLVRCKFNEAFLAQCEHLQDVHVELYGTPRNPRLLINHKVIWKIPTEGYIYGTVLTINLGLVPVKYLDVVVPDPEAPSLHFIGKCELTKCRIAASISINGTDVSPVSILPTDTGISELPIILN